MNYKTWWMLSSFVETQTGSVPLTANMKAASCASSQLCARIRNREWERNISAAQLHRGPGRFAPHSTHSTPLSSYNFPVYPKTLPVHTLCFKQASEETDDKLCVISHTKYFISMQQWWRQAGRINPLKCRTGISWWRGKAIQNQKPLLPFLSCCSFLASLLMQDEAKEFSQLRSHTGENFLCQ